MRFVAGSYYADPLRSGSWFFATAPAGYNLNNDA